LAFALFSSRIDSDPSGSGTSCNSIPCLRPFPSSRNFVQRILLLALLLTSEFTVLSVWLFHSTQLIGTKHDWAAFILRSIVSFAAIFVPCGYLKNKASLEGIYRQIEQTPIRWGLFAAHCSAMIVAVKLSSLLYSGGGLRRADLLTASWFVAGISAIAFAGFAFLSWPIWAQLIRRTGHLWAYASIAVVSAIAAGPYFRRWLWQPGPAINLTFRLTKMFLSPFVSGIVANPATGVIGTQRFRVEITTECSGLEGVGLVLGFGILWLLVFRKECRFPRSLVLIPLGVTLIFLLNAVRIAALVLIGNAGAEQIAVNGFHSQAGWIAFSAVSVGFCFVMQRVPWFTTKQQRWESLGTATHNPTATFLLPFLMILAAGMIAGAATGAGSPEWLYPLRFFAAAGMLWVFRRSYAGLNWRFDWLAPAIGAIVFVIWIGLDRFSNPDADRGVSATLMASSTVARVTWITFRVLAAVVTVPLAEELAFRGFLMRRLISSDFDSVSFRRFSWFALLASSVAFGLLHGGYRVAGIVAGILFGLAVIRRGRIGEAVVAHATANVLLAGYVLAYHQWHLW
jgi:exosortase E/protease (VPEID-CTERM system)